MSPLYDLARELDEALSNFEAHFRDVDKRRKNIELEFRKCGLQGVESVRDRLREMAIAQDRAEVKP